jgi:hypothetical protein
VKSSKNHEKFQGIYIKYQKSSNSFQKLSEKFPKTFKLVPKRYKKSGKVAGKSKIFQKIPTKIVLTSFFFFF